MVISRHQVEIWCNSETLWSRVLEKHPHLELPHRSRGKYYSKKSLQAKSDREKKMYEEKAYNDFREAIKLGTKSADVYMGIGIICGSQGELKNAILYLNKSINMDPKKGSAYYNRALIYDQLNQKEAAINDYNMALIYKPQMALEILNNRSNLFLETGKFKEAILDFDYLISIESNNFLYYCNRAVAKQQLKDIPGAVADFQKALKLRPDDQISRNQLEIILKNQK
jgi:tetratricopeptide (TPR) repeat protein